VKKCCAEKELQIMTAYSLYLVHGFALECFYNPNDLHVELRIENRGRHGYVAGATIYKGVTPLSSMTLQGAMKYIIRGGNYDR